MTPTQLDALFTEARKIIIDLLELEQPVIAAINAFLEKRPPHFTGR